MAKRKKMTADEKADQKVKYYQSLENKYQKRWKIPNKKEWTPTKRCKLPMTKKKKPSSTPGGKKLPKQLALTTTLENVIRSFVRMLKVSVMLCTSNKVI